MRICLDAGHYGKYNRSKVVPSYYESEMNWKLVGLLAKELESFGFEVVMTRENQSKDLDLVSRGKKSKGCDLFLSIHSNDCDTESVDYPLVVTMLDGKGDKLGQEIAQKIQELMGTVQKGKIIHKEGGGGAEWYGVLRGAAQVGTMGMIIEHSFHSNTKAATWLLVDENLKTMAKAEAEIIASYFGAKKLTEDSATYEVRVGKYTKDEAEAVVKKLTEQGYSASIVGVTETAPAEKEWKPAVGDVVKFTGSKQYSSADSDSIRGAVAGLAEITAMAEGKKHPYHLVRTGSTGPWGWVDAGTFTKA